MIKHLLKKKKTILKNNKNKIYELSNKLYELENYNNNQIDNNVEDKNTRKNRYDI